MKQDKNISTCKVEIVPATPQGWELLRELSFHTWRAANRIISEQYFNDRLYHRLKGANPDADKKKLAEIQSRFFGGKSAETTTYHITKEEYPELPSYVRGALNHQVCNLYGKEKPEVLKGNRAIRSYRRPIPIPVMASGIKLRQDGFSFFKHDFHFRYGRDRSNNRVIIERILAGQYKLCDSSFSLDDKKAFFLCVVEMPDERPPLDPDTIVGVDLGIKVPAYLAINSSPARLAIGSADDFLRQRLRIQAQRTELQRDLKFAGGGKGRAKKLKRMESLKKRERNLVKTMNHRISKEVVAFALRQNAGKIQMEDLSGFGRSGESSRKEKFFLRNWSYYELQQQIQYKARRAGVDVFFIDPAYTSQTCAECKKAGEYDPFAAIFRCQNPECKWHGKEMHGDYNAALNIARIEIPAK